MSRAVPYLTCFCATAAAYLYGSKVGWPPSAQRAFWMVFFVAVGHCSGREVEVWNVLGSAAILILLKEPAQLNTLGFKFSFSAVIGILLITKRFTRLVPPDTPKVVKWCCSAFGVGVGASLGTLPWSALYFQQFSWISPFTNLIATPLMGGVAVPLALVGVLVPSVFSEPFLRLSDLIIWLTFIALEPFAFEPVSPAVGPVGACGLFFLLWLRKKVLWMSLGYLFILAPIPRKDHHFRATFLDVGQGDCTLIRWPDQRNWLIDGGGSSQKLIRYLRREQIEVLDLVVLSHPHQDHMGGFKDLSDAISIKKVLTVRPPLKGESAYKEIWTEWLDRNIPIVFPEDVQEEGLKVLHPLENWTASGADKINEESLVIQIQYGPRVLLFTGDIEEDAEQHLLPKIKRSDVVKVAHHGSKSSSSMPFVAAANPNWAVISCGRGNRFGHPNERTLRHWNNAQTLRTDELGTIEFWMKDSAVEIRSWREETGWRWAFKEDIEPVLTRELD